MSIRLFARLARAHPETHKISLSREFIEVSGTDVHQMNLPPDVVRVDFFADITARTPTKRVFTGTHQLMSRDEIEEHFGPMFSDRVDEAGASHAVFIPDMNKLIPALPGDEFTVNGRQISIG